MTLVSERPAPLFVGESPALDFLNSVATPKSTLIDWLDTETDLLDWLVVSGLCTAEELDPLRDRSHSEELAIALQEVHVFRDAFREFIETNAGRDLVETTVAFVARINEALLQGTLTMRLTAPKDGEEAQDSDIKPIKLTTQYEINRPHDVLPRIAAACAKLICEADFTAVRNCEGPTCTLYFHDVSKNRKRRWCSMSICGNRAKAAAHRKAVAASAHA
jgi:predicted RNA-binding Zn ribbon-like protein